MSVFTAFATFVWSFVLFSYPWLCWLHWLYSPLLLIKAFKWNGEPSWVADTALWWTKGTGACWLGAVNSVFHWCSLTVSLIHLGWGLAEAEVWQSTALSLWSGPLSRKFLQMWSTNGHAVSPDWEGWLTGHRVLNLLLNNFLINLSRLLSELTYPKHGELRQPRPAGYFQNWYVKICTWAFWFLKPYISCVCVCVCIQGRQPSILSAPMLSFLVSIPVLSRRRGGPDEECNFFWLAFPLEQLSCSCLQTNHCKMWKNVSDQTSRSSGGAGTAEIMRNTSKQTGWSCLWW